MNTMRSRHKSAAVRSAIKLPTIFAFAIGIATFAVAQPSAQSHLEQAILANSLDIARKRPFHIKIAFQLFDLAQQPSDVGSVEEWWASPGVSRITMTATSLKSPEPVLLDDNLAMDPREKYLVRELLKAAVHPIPRFGPSLMASAKEDSETFEKTTLTCFTIAGDQMSGMWPGTSKFCTDSGTYGLRMQVHGPFSTIAHNGLGLFHDTHVATAIEIAYADRQAISGKVVTMQSFDPAKSAIALTSVPAATDEKKDVVPGKIVTRINPEFPAAAKASHTSGTVLLHGVISKDGTTRDIYALSSKSPALTQAAVDAVQKWIYKPFTRDGVPVDIETVIAVNFNVSGPFSAGAPLQTTH